MKHPSPTPQDVRELRKRMLLNQTQFGQWLKCSMRSVQQWEAGERVMHPGLWELAQLKEAMHVLRT